MGQTHSCGLEVEKFSFKVPMSEFKDPQTQHSQSGTGISLVNI